MKRSRKKIMTSLMINFLISGFIFWPLFCLGANPLGVVISEIAWMGTTNSANDEFMELYNNTDSEIDLTDWILKASDGTPTINLLGKILANSYFLLERTDDNTLPAVTADQIYTGALGNSGEILELYDNSNNLIDKIDCSGAWFFGDNTTKQTMERKNLSDSGSDAINWQSSQNPAGTPKLQNSGTNTQEPEQNQPQEIPSAYTPPNQPPVAEAGPDIVSLINQKINFSAASSTDPNSDQLVYFWNFGDGATDQQKETSHTYIYPGDYLVTLSVSDGSYENIDVARVRIFNPAVIISEFLPNPPNENDQWIEIFNPSNQIINLSDWILETREKFVIPKNTLIQPKQFLVFDKNISKISLNSETGKISLFFPDGSLASQINYEQAPQNLSAAYNGQKYLWTSQPTPGLTNILTDKNNQSQSISTNNPQPTIFQAQDFSPVAEKTNLPQKYFSVPIETKNNSGDQNQGIKASSQDIFLAKQKLSLIDKTNIPSQPDLILLLSIVVSFALFSSWVVILIRKRISSKQLKLKI